MTLTEQLVQRFERHHIHEEEHFSNLHHIRTHILNLAPSEYTSRGFCETQLRNNVINPLIEATIDYPSLSEDHTYLSIRDELRKIEGELMALSYAFNRVYYPYYRRYFSNSPSFTMKFYGVRQVEPFHYPTETLRMPATTLTLSA